MKITRIAAKPNNSKVRVAVYCRVSTKRDEQEDSLEMQKEAYISLINSRSDWELVGIYSDSISGLSAEKRPDFMRMIKDAMDGKIDRILCKSVSRFSRNVAECKKFTDMLRSKNISVEFEKEHLKTDDSTSTFIFSLMSAVAENESRGISENVRWGYQERFKRGEYNLGNNRILGYDSVDGKLVPNGDAGVIRSIFRQYADGVSIEAIRMGLAELGVLTKNGTPLSKSNIQYILRNETYRGDKHLWKQPQKDFITKKVNPNVEQESIYLENDHEALIDEETWAAVQKRIEEMKLLKSVVGHTGGQPHFLYGKVFCGDCGEPMKRRTFKLKSGESYKAWMCRERMKKGSSCEMRIVREEDLIAEICEMLGWDEFNEGRFSREVVRVDVYEDRLEYEAQKLAG